MIRTRQAAAVPAALSLIALVASPAAAQDSPAQLGPDVVVSASRVPLPARETGSAVTVLTDRELDERGVRVVSDVLRDVPGVAVGRSGGVGSFTQIRIRGAEGNQTKVLIDGIDVNNPASSSEFDFGNMLSADIARIEVLRGPQSALYGSDAIGGVINIVTKRPGLGWSGTARGEIGSFATKNTLANLGYGTDKGYFSLTHNGISAHGTSVADARNGNGEADAYRNATTRLKAGLQPTERLNIDAVGWDVTSHRESDASAAGINITDGEDASSSHERYGIVKARWTPLGDGWEHILRAAYGEAGTDFLNSSRRRTFLTFGTRTKFDYQTNYTFRTEGTANAEHTVTFAAEQQRETQLSASSTRQATAISSRGYVGEYRVSLWDHLFLSAGLRYDDNDPLFPDQTTWRGTAAYIYDPWNMRVHASLGRGVKNPTLFELFGSTTNFTGNPNLRPEESIGADFGVEKTLLDGDLIVDATLFRNRFKDFITGSGNTAVNVSGTSQADGLELTAVARPLADVKITAGYTFTYAQDANGSTPIRRARHLGSLHGTYGFKAWNRPARAGLGLRYNGDQKDTITDNFSTSAKHDDRLNGYGLVNATFSWDVAENVEFFARGENLLDKHYQDVFGYGAPGLGVFAGLTVRFGPRGQ